MTAILHAGWLNENQNRRYPFLDSATMEDQTGTLRVPDELIVDLVFPVHAVDYDLTKFYLQRLTVFAGGIVLEIGYEGVSDPIAVRSVTEAEHAENAGYYLDGRGDFEDSAGRIAIGRIEQIRKFGGSYTFDPSATRLLPTVLRPSLKGVRAMRVVSATNEESEYLQGDIELIAGSNIELEVITAPGGDKQLRISAVNNPGYEQPCDCPDTSRGRCIETINEIPPDANGNFTLEGDGCLSITAFGNGVAFNDTCAEPCCGCAELDTLRSELARLGSQVTTQLAFAQRLSGNMDQLRDVILASKLGVVNPCG